VSQQKFANLQGLLKAPIAERMLVRSSCAVA
jgi:hypothetical protein